jgi:MoaA/NifB/PqqE/SkfB family radical SAM enzyme
MNKIPINVNHKKQMHFLTRRGINVDITHRCSLECPRCQRSASFIFNGIKVPGEDLSIQNFAKIVKHFNHVNFCGQVSDPVHHPKFVEFLEMLYKENKSTSVHHASAGKSMNWYPKAFKANPHARWWLALDGTPDSSPTYRINQDGWKMYEIMKIAKEHLTTTPVWQFIVFNYNENEMEIAHKMAKEIGIDFVIVNSSRWLGEDDPLKPSNPEYSLSLNNG